MTQIADHFIQDLQIDEEKTEENIDCSEEENEKCKVTTAVKNEKHENKHKNLLLELLETERNYVQDLEEVVKNLNCHETSCCHL